MKFLIENFDEIIKKYPDIKLILAGDGIMKKYLKEKINQKKMSEYILMPGYVKEIKELIFSSDYIISSSSSEGLPFNILEAMSLKKPVLASEIKGHADLITDAENGYLFRLNKADFLSKLDIILSDGNIKEKVKQSHKIDKYYIDNVLYENIQHLTE